MKVPTPAINPIRLPFVYNSKLVDVNTLIELSIDETPLSGINIFYTINGTNPNPFGSTLHESKTFLYKEPFTLSLGKIVIKAVAFQPVLKMCSNVITKTYKVVEHLLQYPEFLESDKYFNLEMGKGSKNLHSSSIMGCHELSEETEEKPESSFSDKLTLVVEESLVNATTALPSLSHDKHISEEGPSSLQALSAVEEESSTNVTVSSSSYLDENSLIIQEEKLEADISEQISSFDFSKQMFKTEGEPEIPLPTSLCLCCSNQNLINSNCTSCGSLMYKSCSKCSELNPLVASFCLYCGTCFQTVDLHLPVSKPMSRSVGVIAKPNSNDVSTIINPSVVSTLSQTDVKENGKEIFSYNNYSNPKCNKDCNKKTSPGRGYWRQQVDYICRELKIYTNNTILFQKKMSKPVLGHLLSVDFEINENKVFFKIVFMHYPPEK